MKLFIGLVAMVVCVGMQLPAQSTETASLRGTVTDPSGASVPNALVQLRGPGGEKRATTDIGGRYALEGLTPGKYQVRVIARGFSVTRKDNFVISGATPLDVQLTIQAETQVVNVEEEAGRVSTDPSSNASALVLGEKELEALSDDPDELQEQLQAMAGPAAGPNGGQIYIDGFTGNNLPPKSSIREVRINANPLSPEYDRPGFGRIEIFTKPGTDKLHGQAFFQYNKEFLNARSPLLTQSTRPPYQQKFFGFNVAGPVKKQKASFGLDFERRQITENAFILATTLDNNLNLVNVNQGVVTPQTRTSFTPRIDYTLNAKNTLVARYQDVRIESDKEGIGAFNLASRAYDQKVTEHTAQITETAAISPRAINEVRFQFLRADLASTGDNSIPAINVQGAFSGGGAQIGKSADISNKWELTNTSTITLGRHTLKWGGRVRETFLDSISVANFGGTFTFLGGIGPQLDASNQPIPGTAIDMTALERYRRTLLFEGMGLAPAQVALYGGGASQFSLNAGTPATSVKQFDIGLFFNDDWKVRPNLTLSFGARYEAQTNIGDLSDWSPRLGFAWGVDGHGSQAAKTVLRGGFGIFYDRIDATTTLAADRYNGITQQSYLILNPLFYPTIPPVGTLAAGQQQQLQMIYSGIRAPRTYHSDLSVDRSINKYARVSVVYINSRGVDLQRSRDINAPIGGLYPLGDRALRMLTEDTGFSRTNQLLAIPTVNYKKLFLFGFYALSYGKDDNEGQPADPYNLRAEWGPSTFADVRHRLVVGTNLPLPWNFSISPFLLVSSGTPYDITTGHDANGDSFTTERPALVADLATGNCRGGSVTYASGFGCFNLNPGPGLATIGRNYGRGPAYTGLNLRVSRTWSFGNRGESGVAGGGGPIGLGGVHGGEPPRGGPPGGGPPGGGGGLMGMFGGGSSSGKKYNLVLTVSARNVLNHPNYSPPSGDLSSPYFGQYLSLATFGPHGAPSTYNRKLDLQLRFMF